MRLHATRHRTACQTLCRPATRFIHHLPWLSTSILTRFRPLKSDSKNQWEISSVMDKIAIRPCVHPSWPWRLSAKVYMQRNDCLASGPLKENDFLSRKSGNNFKNNIITTGYNIRSIGIRIGIDFVGISLEACDGNATNRIIGEFFDGWWPQSRILSSVYWSDQDD